MEAYIVVSKPKWEDVFVDTERPYSGIKEALEELSWHEQILGKKEIPLSKDEITEISIAGIPFRFFIYNDTLFYQVGLGRLWEGVLDSLTKRGQEIVKGFIPIKLKKGVWFYDVGSIDDMNIYLLIKR